MKKLNILLLITFLVITCTACDNGINNYKKDEIFESVLSSKRTYIDSYGKAVYLKNYKIYETGPLPTKVEQTSLDFDNDGKEELVLKFSCEYEQEFLVLYYNNYDVYGFRFSNRAMLSLKEDGTFMGSGGAACSYYSRLFFENNTYKIINDAVKDSSAGIFELKGENVATEVLNEYINDWQFKKNVEWEEVDSSTVIVDLSDDNMKENISLENEKNENEKGEEVIQHVNGIIYKEGAKVSVHHDAGVYSFSLPNDAIDIEQTDKKVTFALENEFSRVVYLFEVVEDINSAPEAELKVKEITNTLKQEGNTYWYDLVGEKGVSYYYQHWDGQKYDEMYAEMYGYDGGVAIHQKVDIEYYNFNQYYDLLETRIEKNEAEDRRMHCMQRNYIINNYHSRFDGVITHMFSIIEQSYYNGEIIEVR